MYTGLTALASHDEKFRQIYRALTIEITVPRVPKTKRGIEQTAHKYIFIEIYLYAPERM